MVISLVFLGSTALVAQEVQAENLNQETAEKLEKINKPSNHQEGHIFMCQRCGTENVMDLNVEASAESVDLIPHCTFCGKKYWPKFKPSGFLMRSFCKAQVKESKSDTRL
jgi:uncharacterized protein with PIN domain